MSSRSQVDEMSLESLVSRDVQGKSNQESVLTRFRSEEEKDKVRLRVDKRDRSTGEHTVGLKDLQQPFKM